MAAGTIPPERIAETQRLLWNDQLNAAVTGLLAALVLVVVLSAAWEWYRLLSGQREADLRESPFVASQFAEGD